MTEGWWVDRNVLHYDLLHKPTNPWNTFVSLCAQLLLRAITRKRFQIWLHPSNANGAIKVDTVSGATVFGKHESHKSQPQESKCR
jgi:hypothetical protein